jgi:heme-degrading monooxygenase HmoA
MIVRIYWAKTYPGAWPLIEKEYRKLNEIPTPGFRGRLVTQDVNDAESMYTITFWDDLASVQAWEASSEFEKVFVAAIRPHVVGSQSISLCEVKVENIGELLRPPKPGAVTD